MSHQPPVPLDLLPASRPPAPSDAVRELVTGRRVLVTGAAGSVGGALVGRLTALRPAALHLLDVDEGRLHAQQLELTGGGFTPESGVWLTDVRDSRALDVAVRDAAPDLVLHAASLKHVALLERFCGAGLMTNVWGTQNVVRAALRHGVQRVVHVSSDKAADPTSVLGATQRLAELAVRGEDGMRTASVRFGTVLGSRGSFWDTLVHQVATGQPVTVTDPDATRSFMTLGEAAALLLEAAALPEGDGTYVLDAGERVGVLDLVHRYAAAVGLPSPEVTVTGLLPGEKQHETLVGAGERYRSTAVARVRHCAATRRPPGFERVLSALYAAADDADDPRVRRLLAQQFGSLHAGPDDATADPTPEDDAPRAAPVLRVIGPVPA